MSDIEESRDESIQEEKTLISQDAIKTGHSAYKHAGTPAYHDEPQHKSEAPPAAWANSPGVELRNWNSMSGDICSMIRDRRIDVRYPYFTKLISSSLQHPEIFSLLDFALAGDYHCDDHIKLIQWSPNGDISSETLNLTTTLGFHSFQHFLRHNDIPNGSAFSKQSTSTLMIVENLTHVSMEVIGAELDVDPRVFAKHLWSQNNWPFGIRNTHSLDVEATLEDPNDTIVVDCDADTTIMSSSQGMSFYMRLYDKLFKDIYDTEDSTKFRHFFQRTLLDWPSKVSPPRTSWTEEMHFFSVSRVTLHTIQRKPFGTLVLALLSPVPNWAYARPTKLTSITAAGLSAVPIEHYDSGHPLLEPSQLRTDVRARQALERTYANLTDALGRAAGQPAAVFPATVFFAVQSYISALEKILSKDKRRLDFFRQERQSVRDTGSPAESTGERSAALECLKLLKSRMIKRLDTIAGLQRKVHAVLLSEDVQVFGEAHFRRFLQDLASLTQRIENFVARLEEEKTDITTDMQHQLTVLQINESRRAMEANDQVRKLTILAFFFIPISTITSVFGMNLKEWQGNAPSAGAFGITVGVVAVVTLLFASFGMLKHFTMGLMHYCDVSSDPWLHLFVSGLSFVAWLLSPLKLLIRTLRATYDMGKQQNPKKKS